MKLEIKILNKNILSLSRNEGERNDPMMVSMSLNCNYIDIDGMSVEIKKQEKNGQDQMWEDQGIFLQED